MKQEQTSRSMIAFSRSSQLVLHVFAWVLLMASLWGLVILIQLWNRPARLASGTPARVIEEIQAGRRGYLLPFKLAETNDELEFRLSNDGAVIDYFMTNPGKPAAILYWPSEMTIASVHPLEAGKQPIRGQYPPYNALLGTSALGVVLAIVLLCGKQLDRGLYRIGRG